MAQRNMIYTSQMMDMEMDQQGERNHPEPLVFYRSTANFPPPNIHAMLPAPGNTTNFDVHLPEHHDNALFYGMMQYNGVQHHHPCTNPDLVVTTSSNHYNPYSTPPLGTRVFPVPLNQGPHDQFPFSNNHGYVGVAADSYGTNSHFMDGARGSFKRKNGEGIPGNFQYFNASAGSSSSAAPNARPQESDVRMDTASFAVSESGGNDVTSIMEVGSHRSVRNRSGGVGLDNVLMHNNQHLIQGNYQGQPFQTATNSWLDQQFSTNGGDIGTLNWNQAPPLPYLHGSINGVCMEGANVQGYQLTAGNRSSTTFLHPPPIPQCHPNFHQPPPPPPPVQSLRGHNMDLHSQGATSLHRFSTNGTLYTSMNPFQDAVDVGPRYVEPVPPPTGLRMYRPNRRDVMFEANSRQRNLPHLRVLPEDGVAILEIPGYREAGESGDHHRDMRLDIDHMSYEELLALGEQIGSVGSGLSEEYIISHLRRRTFALTTCSKLEEAACVDPEIDFCVICQTDYKDQAKIGTLDCGHEYHVDCIKKWLLVKNTCPICKSSAITMEKRDL